MSEAISYQNTANNLKAQMLKSILATLDDNRLYSTEDLMAAARAYVHNPQYDQEPLDFDHTPEETSVLPLALDSELVVEELPNDSVPEPTALHIPTINRLDNVREIKVPKEQSLRKRAKQFGLRALPLVATVGLVFGAMKATEPNSSVKNVEAGTAPASTTSEVPTPLITPRETAVEVAALPSTTSLTPESTTTSTTEAPTTTTTTILAAEAPLPELTLSEKILAGQTTLRQNPGQPLGQVSIDKYCDVINLYVENKISYKLDGVAQQLSPEAQAMIEQLKDSNLTPKQRQKLDHDIMQKGFIDGTGDPLYALYPDNTPEGDCEADGPNPRAHPAFGSTAAVNSGQDATFFQPTGDISEYGSIPGQEGVMYITVHNQTESSAGAALDQLPMGATITHSVDGQTRHYQKVGSRRIYGLVPFPDLMKMLNEEAKGKKRLVFQTCINDNPIDRALFYFDEVEA